MGHRTSLSGQRVLVVEDDYYLATDTARALKLAGAEVAGPFPSEAAARGEIARTTCAVLDIKIHGGRAFDLARELNRKQAPFVFVTGYEAEIIPHDLAGAPRLLKPVRFEKIIDVLARTLGVARAPARPASMKPAPARFFQVGDRVMRRDDETGTVAAVDDVQFKVKWDAGGTSYFRHSAQPNLRKAPGAA